MDTKPASTELHTLAHFTTLPNGLGTTSVRSLARWCAVGHKFNGRTIRLKSVRVGGSWKTCEAWIIAFIEQLTDAATN